LIDQFVIFNNTLYAVGKNIDEGAFVWQASANGNTWTQVGDIGFGDPVQQEAMAAAVFENALYVSTYNANATPAIPVQIWRTTNGTIWSPVISNGFGDLTNDSIRFW